MLSSWFYGDFDRNLIFYNTIFLMNLKLHKLIFYFKSLSVDGFEQPMQCLEMQLYRSKFAFIFGLLIVVFFDDLID